MTTSEIVTNPCASCRLCVEVHHTTSPSGKPSFDDLYDFDENHMDPCDNISNYRCSIYYNKVSAHNRGVEFGASDDFLPCKYKVTGLPIHAKYRDDRNPPLANNEQPKLDTTEPLADQVLLGAILAYAVSQTGVCQVHTFDRDGGFFQLRKMCETFEEDNNISMTSLAKMWDVAEEMRDDMKAEEAVELAKFYTENAMFSAFHDAFNNTRKKGKGA